MSEQKVLIDCRDAALGYEGRPIWEHLTFQVRRGDYLCIVGDNGSGKSTLLKSMLGLLRPLSGEIRLDESLRRGAIGYLPQQTRAQKDFPATVSEIAGQPISCTQRRQPTHFAASTCSLGRDLNNAMQGSSKMTTDTPGNATASVTAATASSSCSGFAFLMHFTLQPAST